MPSSFCPNDRWFYFSKAGQMRTVYEDGIYTSLIDEDGWPSGICKKIRNAKTK